MAQFKVRMLWDNIEKGDLTAVHGLLERGNINLEERDNNGRTFLMMASEKGELNIVRELLEADVDPNAVDNESWSALLCASKEGHLEIVIELLDHRAQLEHKDMCGWTALMWASYKGRVMVVQELLDRGANVNAKADHSMSALAWAAGRGHTDIVMMLVSKGAKVNAADKYGTTPLIWACRKGFIDIVDALLADGANADASGMNSWTPLLVATKGGHSDVVHSLLQHDPNVNATDKDGLTSLAIAAKEGYVEIVQDLLSRGAYVNVGDRSGDSILIHAVKGGQIEVVRALLDKYVDVDVQGSEDKTSLYWAVEKGYNEIVRLLLGSEPDLELCTKDEDTALLRAVRSRNEECVRLLLEKGAKVSASDKRGDTALHIAIRARSKRITELLLRNPRNSRLLYRPNKAGETPYAMDTYHQRGILQGIYGHRNLNASDAENLLGYDIYSSAMADILSDPTLSTPITVGLYAKWGSGKSFLISKLQSEMKSFTQQSTEEHFSLTLTVVVLVLLLSLLVGEALVLAVNFKVGIGVAVAIFFAQLIFFGAVMICGQHYSMKIAVKISTVLGRRQRRMMLLLRMLFCNPRRSPKAEKKAANQYAVRFLFSDCTRLTSVAGEKALAAMIATLCLAIEREYGFIVTRLFRVFKPTENQHKKSRFKSLCCIPYFLLVLFVVLCMAGGVALLVSFKIEDHTAVKGVLIAIACILTLALVGNVYTWAQAFMALIYSQKRRVLKAADHVDSLRMDGFLQCLKQEVDLMSRMVMCMDTFTDDQTRLVIIVDGLDSCEQGKVLQVLDTVKSLFSDDGSPFITILAVDPHIIIKGIEQNLKISFQDSNVNGFDYLRNVVHLPFYLQSQGLRIQHEDDAGKTLPKLAAQESLMSNVSVESKASSRRKSRAEGLAGSQHQVNTSSFDLSDTFARNDYFSDINPRSMRRLMNIVSVTARLLRAYNIDFKWHRLAAWINIIEQWPYRVSWVIYLFEELDVVESSTSLCSLYQRVLPRIPMTKESEPLLEIDRNARKLEAFLSSQSPNLPRLNVGDLRKFLPCTINLDPYLRKLIRDTEHQNEMLRQEMNTMGGIYPGSQQPFLSPPQPSSTPDTLSMASWNRPSHPGPPASRMGPHLAGYQGAGMAGMGMGGGVSIAGTVPSAHSLPATFTSPSRPHPSVFFNNAAQLVRWSELDVQGVCSLLGLLKGVTPDVLCTYTASVQENNISGLVLQNCDLDELRPVLQMRFGDWQLFKAAILSLREWDGCLLGAAAAEETSNNSSTQSVPTSTGGMSAKEVETATAAKEKAGFGKVVGPKGRRMRRNDSIIQQLSFEAAILHEALEEFPEDSDGEGAVGFDESFDGVTEAQDAGRMVNFSDPKSLSSMITVLDAPGKVEHSSDGMMSELNPFALNTTFPSGVHLPPMGDSSGGPPVASSVDISDGLANNSHRNQQPFLSALSHGLEKIARPFKHAFDHHSHSKHHSLEEEGGEDLDSVALIATPPSENVAMLHVDEPREARASPWHFHSPQHSVLSPDQTEVTLEMVTQKPVFSLGDGQSPPSPPSIARPTLTVENETTGAFPGQSDAESLSQEGQSEIWQPSLPVSFALSSSSPSPTASPTHPGSDHKDSERGDRESFV